MAKEKTHDNMKTPDAFSKVIDTVAPRILSDPVIQQVAEFARRQKMPLYVVGGAMRDVLLGRAIKDYDFVVKDALQSFFDQLGVLLEASVFPLGKRRQEQVYRLVQGEKTIDVALMAGDDIGQDLMRRDFTINAIAYAFAEGQVVALPQAMDDLKAGRIDVISPQALEMDPVRMLRAIRYQCTLPGFELTARVRDAILHHRTLLSVAAPERIKAELDQIILSAAPADGLRLMHELGLLTQLFPELVPLAGLPQGRYHATDALAHTLVIVGEVERLARYEHPFPFQPSEQGRLILGYAALFHDLGKATTQSRDEQGEIHFYGHPQESSLIAQEIMRRLRFANTVKDRVALLVENHMRILTLAHGEPQDKALRRLIHTMGEDIILLLLLGLAETGSQAGAGGDQERFRELCQRLWDLYKKEDLIAPEPLLKGRDLLALGYAPGPRMGEILNEVKQRQIAGELRDKEEALTFVRQEYLP